MERADVLELDEVHRMIDKALEIGRPDYAALVAVATAFGLRIGDVHDLRFGDLFDGEGRVRDSLTLTENKRKRVRTLKTPLWCARILEKYRDWFINCHGSLDLERKMFPWTPTRSWQITKMLAKATGVGERKRVSPHSFRKCFATEIYRRTRDPVLTCAITGHSSPLALLAYIGLSAPSLEAILGDWAGIDLPSGGNKREADS